LSLPRIDSLGKIVQAKENRCPREAR
jgi:hypothetical protein